MSESATAILFVLRDAELHSREPQSFGVEFPGVWVPGEPKSLEDLGMSLSEARERIKRDGLPIDEIHPKTKQTKTRARSTSSRQRRAAAPVTKTAAARPEPLVAPQGTPETSTITSASASGVGNSAVTVKETNGG